MATELSKFLSHRESSYRRLEQLVALTEKRGLKKLSSDEIRELGNLYRLASSDLARARYVIKSQILTEYLNELVGRAHHLIHRRRLRFSISLKKFALLDFPVTFRSEFRMILLSAILIIGTGILGGIAWHIDNDWGQLVMDQPGLRQYEKNLESGPSGLASGIGENVMIEASTFIILNNIRACLVAAAGGFLFGLGTMATLMFNGFLLGVIGAMFLSRGPEYSLYFWSGVLPHGVLEIPAISIAGAAGFILARGLLLPGKLSRGDAVRKESKTAMILLGGVVLLLILAGLIEGFITPMKISAVGSGLKIAFSLLLFTALILYLKFTGTQSAQSKSPRTSTHIKID